jgi:hypothetical protein
MSNFKAIAGVSRTLRRLLLDRMEAPTPQVTIPVTIAPPDVQVSNVSGRRVNLFLYEVTENGYLKNQEIPGQGHPTAYGHPPLSLDLHYLITAFDPAEQSQMAGDSDHAAQELLGNAMRVLHDFAIMTDDLKISNSGAATDGKTVGDPILDDALLSEYERVKLSLKPLGIDELNKIWTALTVKYRLSVAYQVSVVQIESQRPRKYPQPVGELPSAGPRVYVVPFRSPRINEIKVRRPGDPADMERPFPYVRIGDFLIIRGQNFANETTRVILGTADVIPTIIRDDRIEVEIPDDGKLQPGTHPVKVVMDMLMGEPPTLHKGFNSNLAVFMTVPHITNMTPDLSAAPRVLQINGTRLFHPDLECLTLVGDEVITSDNYTTKTPTTIAFNLPDTLGSGNYAVRVRVNGVESIEVILNIS